MLGLEHKGYDKIFSSILLRLVEIFREVHEKIILYRSTSSYSLSTFNPFSPFSPPLHTLTNPQDSEVEE